MKHRHLDHFIFLIMAGCASVLSIVFSAIVFFAIQSQERENSYQLANDLMSTVASTATAALFSNNEAVGQDVINGLMSNASIHSVKLEGYADELAHGLLLTDTNPNSKRGLEEVSLQLQSPFGEEQPLGQIIVKPSADWIKQNAQDRALTLIVGLIIVIFSACFIAAQMIKVLISAPLANTVKQLTSIKPGDNQRLKLPEHLLENEIGALISEFNAMLEKGKQALLVERELRQHMEVVQKSLEKAKDQAEKATEAKSNFLAIMSHEIRTPMNSIIGFLDLAIQDDSMEPETLKHLEISSNSARYLLQLINDILDVSKIENGKIELEHQSFDLANLLNEVHQLMLIKANEKQLRLTLIAPENFAPAYTGDPYRLQQILLNLIGNAIKFTHQGNITINITQQGESTFTFSVTDTGVGIPEDKIEQILEPFTQVDASITRQYGGTGLGTTIASDLIKLMGGKLNIASTLGEGSCFHFTIVLPPATISAPNQQQSLTQNNITNKPLLILVADDVEENIALTRIHLEKAGHTVHAALNGKQAVEQAKQHQFDLLLIDLQMPVMNGYQACEQIRTLNPHCQQIPIIVLTANTMDADVARLRNLEITGLVTKPVNFNELFSLIHQETIASAATAPAAKLIQDAMIFDYQAALENWLEPEALKNALDSFSAANSELTGTLQGSIEQANFISISELAHKIKGSAGNLSLVKLAHLAAKLESSAIAQELASVKTMATQFSQSLKETLATIAELEWSIESKSIIGATQGINKEQCLDAIKQLKEACCQNDPDIAEDALSILDEQQFTQVAGIKSALQQFDFYKVDQLASELLTKLNQNGN